MLLLCVILTVFTAVLDIQSCVKDITHEDLALLSVTAHFPSILMAWETDSFYASRVALFYGIVVFLLFFIF